MIKKQLLAVILAATLLLAGCSSTADTDTSTAPEQSGQKTEASQQADDTQAEQKTTLTLDEFDALLAEQPLGIIETEYIEQDSKYKNLYPDLLSAVLQNNTNVDIRDAVVAFVAWDENGLPVKLKGNIDFYDGTYVKNVNYSDINLIGGETFGKGKGYELDNGLGIASFKAVAISFESFDGDTWENPYADTFLALYEGQKFDESATVEVTLAENTFAPAEKAEGASDSAAAAVDPQELEALLLEAPLAVIDTEYIVQNSKYKNLYPDLLSAILQNNTDADIRDAVVAFVAWDENGLPVKLKGNIDFNDGTYLKEVKYNDINLVGGATFGKNKGYELDTGLGIADFKAVVVSYETFDGESWENPHYKEFRTLYEGQRLG